MIEIIETKNVYSDGSVRATVMSDTSAELTGITSVDGKKLRFGSLAVIAKEDVVCKLASNGVWYKSGISLEDVTVTPSTSQQTVTAGEGYDGIGTVTVEAVSLENKTVTPSTSQQTITAGANYNGIGTVTVGAVTSAIDRNILSDNIKNGVTILGVPGTYLGEDPEAAYLLAGMIQRNVSYLNIPSGVTRIGDYAFAGCTALQEMVLAEITSIGMMAFAGCIQLDDIILSDSITTIGDYAFSNCQSLTYIEIPDSVTTIGSSAFMMCTSLESIAIPSSVTSIGENAFMMCTNLEYIEINKEENSISGAPWGATNAEIVWIG